MARSRAQQSAAKITPWPPEPYLANAWADAAAQTVDWTPYDFVAEAPLPLIEPGDTPERPDPPRLRSTEATGASAPEGDTPAPTDSTGRADDSDPASPDDKLSLRTIGIAYLAASVVLVMLIVWLVPGIIRFLTTPLEASKNAITVFHRVHGLEPETGAIEGAGATKAAEGAATQKSATVAADNQPALSPLLLEAVVGLEHESMMLRVEGIQVAFGFIAGVIFVPAGLVLFAAGVTGGFQFSGKAATTELRLVSSAPGLLLVLIGGILIALATTKDVRRDFNFRSRLGETASQEVGRGNATMNQKEDADVVPDSRR